MNTKKIALWLITGITLTAIIFSCKKKDDDDDVIPPPIYQPVGDTVGETIKPVITLTGGDQTVNFSLTESYIDPGCSATDNVDGNLTNKIIVSGSVDRKKAGEYALNYTVTDKAGNSASKKRKVFVKITQDNLCGNYSHIDNIGGNTYPSEYETINKSALYTDRIVFTKFAGFTNLTPYAIISGNDGRKLFIPEQTFHNCGFNQTLTIKVISDTIMIADNAASFTITYKLHEGTSIYNCWSAYIKQ